MEAAFELGEHGMELSDDVYQAAGRGDMTALDAWLRRGGNVDARRGEIGTTMLFAASASGEEATVTALLERGAGVNMQSNDGNTALMIASANNHADTVAARRAAEQTAWCHCRPVLTVLRRRLRRLPCPQLLVTRAGRR